MELIELQNIWENYDKKISENTRLNKEILRRMLLSKPEKRFNWIIIKAAFNVALPIVLIVLVFIPHIEFRSTLEFISGFILFMSVFILSYTWDVKYFLLIRKIDFSSPILSIKKGIAELEKYKIKTTRIRYILMPFAISGIFLMLIQKPIFNKESIVMLALMVMVFIGSIYFTFKYSIYERFRKLNKEIAEIEELEKL